MFGSKPEGILIIIDYSTSLLFTPSSRETEAFESVTEDEQLPQVVDELQDIHVSPGSPIAKMQLKVKGVLIHCSAAFISVQQNIKQLMVPLRNLPLALTEL